MIFQGETLKPSLEGWKLWKPHFPQRVENTLKPSLEGWKPQVTETCGMLEAVLETFLRGMETSPRTRLSAPRPSALKPSLEGWKPPLPPSRRSVLPP